MLACEIDAPLKVIISFPCGSLAMNAAGWTKPPAHKTTAAFQRTLDNDSYSVSIQWRTEVLLERQENAGTVSRSRFRVCVFHGRIRALGRQAVCIPAQENHPPRETWNPLSN